MYLVLVSFYKHIIVKVKKRGESAMVVRPKKSEIFETFRMGGKTFQTSVVQYFIFFPKNICKKYVLKYDNNFITKSIILKMRQNKMMKLKL